MDQGSVRTVGHFAAVTATSEADSGATLARLIRRQVQGFTTHGLPIKRDSAAAQNKRRKGSKYNLQSLRRNSWERSNNNVSIKYPHRIGPCTARTWGLRLKMSSAFRSWTIPTFLAWVTRKHTAMSHRSFYTSFVCVVRAAKVSSLCLYVSETRV